MSGSDTLSFLRSVRLFRNIEAPELGILAEYELTEDERATVLAALARLGQGSAGQRAAALRTALIRRVAT